MALGEAEGVAAQLLTLPPFPASPSIDALLFDDDPRLRVVAYANDGFILVYGSQAT